MLQTNSLRSWRGNAYTENPSVAPIQEVQRPLEETTNRGVQEMAIKEEKENGSAPIYNSFGTKTLLIGPPGSRKTTSLVSFIEAGLDLFAIGTDPGFEEVILDAIRERNLPLDKFHYSYIAPASVDFDTMITQAKQVGNFGYEGLASIKSGPGKGKYNQFIELLSCLSDFTDKRTGESFGPVDQFPPNVALAIDSLSGINVMAIDLVLGGKVTAHQGEWGVAMAAEEKLILKL